MNTFLRQFLRRLRDITTYDDVYNLYGWIWDHKGDLEESVGCINKECKLEGNEGLKPDLPCITVGGVNGVLLVSANPGWSPELNEKEELYCQQSKQQYMELMSRFFVRHPEVVGRRIGWWANALDCIKLLKNWESRFGLHKGQRRWERADETRLIGGWELLPFHSSSDGMSRNISKHEWLLECASASVNAALRLKPEVLFVASKHGSELVHDSLLAGNRWKEVTIGTGHFETRLAYSRLEDTEVILLYRQMFASHRNFKNQELYDIIDRLRREW